MAGKAVEEDLANVEFETSEDVEVIPTFDRMGLREDLLRGIYAYGFEKPSAIQQRAIRPLLKGRDVIAQAQSGTGKTATFSISVLQSIDTAVRETQVHYILKFFLKFRPLFKCIFVFILLSAKFGHFWCRHFF